jgi:mannonate dehydratase
MQRRDLFKLSALGAGLVGLPWLASQPLGSAATQVKAPDPLPAQPPMKNLSPLKIANVKTILTAPAKIRLVVVKVETNEPGLHGLGCATFTQRARVVETAVDKYLKPFLLGKNPLNIEDVWHSCFVSSYWRNGPVLGNAISGVDMALWDILGKRAGVPVYQLLGGKCRNGVDTYKHANGKTFQEVEKAVRAAMEKGWRHVRAQVAIPGLSTYGTPATPPDPDAPPNARTEVWEPGPYVRTVPKLFEHLRKNVGDDVELLHDMHERVPPILAMKLAKDLEPFRLFFLEDPLSPEDVGYFRHMRQQTTTPLAMGELFNNTQEWLSLVTERLIDFIRIHISQVGGITFARKVAALCEFFAVRTLAFYTVARYTTGAPPLLGSQPCASRNPSRTAPRQSASPTSASATPRRRRATPGAARRPVRRRGAGRTTSRSTSPSPCSTPAARRTTASTAPTRPRWASSWSWSGGGACRTAVT